MKLNRTGSNWNELERNKVNENWRIIEGGYNDVVGQITDEVVGHLIDSAKINWKEPVESEADLPKDAEVGETRMVRESVGGVSHVYRYNGSEWELIQEIDATLVNEVDRRLTAQLAQTVNALGDRDLRTAILESQGQRLSLPPGTIELSNRVSIGLNDNLEIIGNNTKIIIDIANLPDTNKTLLTLSNNKLKMNTNVIGDISNREITLEEVTNIKVGDGIVIKTDEVYASREGFGSSYFKGFVSKVEKIEGSTVTIKDSVPYTFSSLYNITAEVFEPISVAIKGVDFEIVGAVNGENTNLVVLNNLYNFTIDNCDFGNAIVSHISTNNCYDSKITNCSIEGNKEFNVSLNYGIMCQNTHLLTVEKTSIDTLRHSINLSGIPSTQVVVDDCNLISESGRSFDSHCSESFEVRNSKLYQGVSLGLGHSSFINCDIYSPNDSNHIVFARADASQFLKSATFKDCRFFHRGTLSNDYIFGFHDASYLEYVGDITFKNCEFTHLTGNFHYIFMFSQISLFEKIGDIVVDSCYFKTPITGGLFQTNTPVGASSSDMTNKRLLIFTNNTIVNAKIRMYTGMDIFKNIIIKDNKGLIGEFTILIDGGTVNGVNAGEVSVVDNISHEGELRVTNINNNVTASNNMFLNMPTAARFFGNITQLLIKNIVKGNSIQAEATSNTVGWNRRLDEGILYSSLSTGTRDLESE